MVHRESPAAPAQNDAKAGLFASGTSFGFASHASLRAAVRACQGGPASPVERALSIGVYVPRSSRASHALASRQSRITVCGET